MWYISIHTNKFVRDSISNAVDNITGKGTFDFYVKTGALRPVENPEVIDILKTNHSIMLAATRLKEIEGCHIKEALEKVKTMKEELLKENE